MEKDFADQVPYESNDRGRKPPRGWRRKLLNVLHRAFLFVFLLFFCLGILLQFPVFQNWAARKVTAALEKSLETKVRVGHLRIGWMGSLVLKEVLVYDHRPDTLLYCASLTARFDPNIFNLARNGLTINSFSLNDAYLDLYTGPEGGSNNLQQLLDRLLPPRTDKKSTFSVRLKKLALRNIFLRNENRLTGSRPGQTGKRNRRDRYDGPSWEKAAGGRTPAHRPRSGHNLQPRQWVGGATAYPGACPRQPALGYRGIGIPAFRGRVLAP